VYKNLVLAGSVAGILGIITCFTAGLARVAGYYWLAGYQSTTIFNVGIGLMVFACLVKLDALQSQTKQQ